MLWRSFKSFYFYNEFIILISVFALISVCKLLGISCLFYVLTGIPCPTCNMTRALISLASFNIKAYIDYNIMALPVSLVFLCELFIDLFRKHKKALHISSVIILATNIAYYVYRLTCGII
jgi:hypothetical protein